jgi:hypothetical protein
MKGQYFSFDAIIGAVIFVLALVALLSYWHSVRSFLDYQNDPLTKEAIRISNSLFTPPSPLNTCAMSRFGLAVGIDDRRINGTILSCAGISEEALKKALVTPYNITITVSDASAAVSPVTFGTPVQNSNAANMVNIRRLATVVNPDGSTYLATVDLQVYQ